MECCKFGKVECVVTLPDQPYYTEAVIVAFEDVQAAQQCGEAMDGRFFDFRQVREEPLH